MSGWRAKAACGGKNLAIFLPIRIGNKMCWQPEAANTCKTCDVIDECLVDAIADDDQTTWRAGMSPADRNKEEAEMNKQAIAKAELLRREALDEQLSIERDVRAALGEVLDLFDDGGDPADLDEIAVHVVEKASQVVEGRTTIVIETGEIIERKAIEQVNPWRSGHDRVTFVEVGCALNLPAEVVAWAATALAVRS